MAETKTKKWSPPKGWESTDYTEEGGSFTGTRTYPGDYTREILAHSTEQFEELAAAQDAEVAQLISEQKAGLLAQADGHLAEAKRLKAQAEDLD